VQCHQIAYSRYIQLGRWCRESIPPACCW
jgi:hypothetical protein